MTHLIPNPGEASEWRRMQRVVSLLEGAAYTFAKTMADAPHWYTLRENWNDDDYQQVGQHIVGPGGEYGYWRTCRRKYLHANGWKYWVMSEPDASEVLNRARAHYEVAGGYDNLASDYDRVCSDPRGDAAAVDLLRESWPRLEGGVRVLDIGCGTGWMPDHFALYAGQYVGIDPSEGMLRQHAAKHPNLVHSLHCVPFRHYWPADGKFDLVVAAGGAAHFLTAADVRRAVSMVRPGGTWFLMFFRDDANESAGFVPDLRSSGHELLKESGHPVQQLGRFDGYIGKPER